MRRFIIALTDDNQTAGSAATDDPRRMSRRRSQIAAMARAVRASLGYAVLCVLVTMMAACGSNALRDRINATFPPLSTLDQQWSGIAFGRQELQHMTPDLWVRVSAKTVAEHLQRVIGEHVSQLSNVVVAPGRQDMTANATFNLDLAQPPVHLEGRLIGSVTAAVDGQYLVLLPAFRTVKLSRAVYGGTHDLEVLIPVVNRTLEAFIENINGQVAAIAERRIPLMVPSVQVPDMKAVLSKVPGFSEVSATPIQVNVGVRRAALLLSPDNIEILGEFGSPRGDGAEEKAERTSRPHVEEAAVAKSYGEFVRTFKEARRAVAEDAPSGGMGLVAVRKRALSGLLNEALAGVEVCGTYTGQTGRQDFRTTIAPFEYPENFGCDATRDCSAQGDCSLQEDTRNCKVSGPFGIEFNNPACEAAKAAQNAGYAVAKANCEAKKSAAKLDCERIKATEKGLCEVNKEWLKRVAATGPIGDVAGHLDVTGHARACVRGLHVGEKLDAVYASFQLENGNADLRGDLEFTPKNLGHLACVSKWQEPFQTAVALPPQTRDLSGNVAVHTEADVLRLTLSTQPTAIEGQLDPPPFQAVFNAHPHLYVVCLPTAMAVFGHSGVKALRHEDLDPIVSGKMRRDVPGLEVALALEPIDVALEGKALHGVPRWGKDAVIVALSETRAQLAQR
jgi:hypothetical protein